METALRIRRKQKEPKEPRIGLTCMRLNEMFRVHKDQITLNCSKCGEQCGVFPSGQRVLAAYGDRVDIICNHCNRNPPDAPAPGALDEHRESKWRWEK